MRIKMAKYLFIGAKSVQDPFFEKAQKMGCFQFIPVSGPKQHLLPKGLEELKGALHVLKKQPVVSQDAPNEQEKFHLAERINHTKSEIERLREEGRLLKAEIVKVHPLGEFDLEEFLDLQRESKKNFQFFFTRHERLSEQEIPQELIFINREYDLDYYLYIGDQKFYHPAFTEVYVRKPLSTLYKDQAKIELELTQKEGELRDLAKFLHYLEDLFLQELSQVHLNFAKEDVNLYLEEEIFAIEAWVPVNKRHKVDSLIEKFPIYAKEVAIEERDMIPTHLENKGAAALGQDLVYVYDVPSIRDKDPSPWVVWAFTAFFSMIVADAGYGVIFLLASLLAKWKFRKAKGVKKRLLKLATLVSCGCIIWGVLIGSFFSIKVAPTSVFNRYTILYAIGNQKVNYHLEQKDEVYKEWVHEFPILATHKTPEEFFVHGAKNNLDGSISYELMEMVYNSILLEIALLVGIIHLSLAFIRNLYRNWSGVGWIAMIIGGYLYFPKIVEAVPMVQYLGLISTRAATIIGEQLLYGGFVLAMALAIIQEKWFGLIAISKVIEIFADTLSYLRLYALGLASVVMASTFNDIAASTGGYIVAVIILFLGHSVNITLSIMAGIIHGTRLNFLEWYHHCFEGGGKQFNPLRILVRE